MSGIRSTIVVLGSAAATLAVVGLGAGATFTDATHSVQKVQAGTLNMTLNSPDGTQSADGKTLTLREADPVGSSFATAPYEITITNSGTIAASEVHLGASDTTPGHGNDAALRNQMYVCVFSSGQTAFNGKLTDLEANGLTIQGTVAPGGTDSYTAEYYAGTATTKCGASAAPSLDNAAQGGLVTPSIDLGYEG